MAGAALVKDALYNGSLLLILTVTGLTFFIVTPKIALSRWYPAASRRLFPQFIPSLLYKSST